MDSKRLMTNSLRASARGEAVAGIMAAALEAVDPAQAIRSHIQRQGKHLIIGKRDYDLSAFKRVLVIGFGKASVPMIMATADILGQDLTQGIALTKTSPAESSPLNSRIAVLKGSHPIPDESSLTGAQQVIDLLSTTKETDLVIFLISGGGSALLTSPRDGISLDDLGALTKSMLACGATINEINCLRKHLSQVKGGQLARMAFPAQSVALILSDVVGDPLDVIASGPTVADPTTFGEALAILEKYNITATVPQTVVKLLTQGVNGKIMETPKVGDPIFSKSSNLIIGSNLQAAQAAFQKAKSEGFNTSLLTTYLQGEARVVGQVMAAIARQMAANGDPVPAPACLIAGGETTVTLLGNGLGGRNQELALSAVPGLAGIKDVMLITLATDGNDGPTDAAGAVVNGDTLKRGVDLGMDPENYLSRNDAYHFFDPLGDLLKPGITETNVCDLTFIFKF
jgi:glycerate 2-kinase